LLLTIEKLIYGGDGLARLPADDLPDNNQRRGKAVFIPFVLEGEEVEAHLIEQKRGFARGLVDTLAVPSVHRVEPPCPYFARCGGCHYQHSNYDHQLEIKAAILKENLRRIAKLELETELNIHRSPEWSYRNRTRLTLQTTSEFALCYHKFNSHQLLPIEQCPISSPLINRAIVVLWDIGRNGIIPGEIQEIEMFANASDTELLIEAHCKEDVNIDPAAAQRLHERLQFQIPEVAGVVIFKDHASSGSSDRAIDREQIQLAGRSDLVYKTSQSSYRVSAGSFFQVNRYLIDELVSIVTAGRSGGTALDLYAGVGLFSSVLYREFQRVIAVESSQTSYADLLYNSPPNVKAVQATTEHYLKKVGGKLHPDLVVLDPPRGGLSESVTKLLASLRSPRITYVSCDPATVARDLRGLLDSGYRVEQAHLVDLFPQTFHIESVFHLVR
jgi:23S rRNA (uracil1939-C5)-methyltransferase